MHATGAATIRDVAKHAGVSVATVSRVLSGSAQVNAAMAEQVQRSARALGYRTNRVARALRQQSTQLVGLVVPDLTNPFFPKVVQSIEGTLRQDGFDLILADARDSVAEEAAVIASLIDHRIDGLLISPCDAIASRNAVRMAANKVPTVQVDRRSLASLHYVGVDQADAIRQLVEHLTSSGRRRLAYIASSPNISTASERIDAFLRLVSPSDADVADRVLVGDFSIEWGREAAERLIAGPVLPDAIVCANDLTATGALHTLQRRGIRVPDDVAVTGFDDTMLATAVMPELTTVRQPLAQLGSEAARVLRTSMATPDFAPREVRLTAELVVRESSLG